VPPVAENCGFDSACIQRNEIASDAYLAAKYVYDYGGPPPSNQGVVVQQGGTPFVNLPPVQTVNVDGTPVQARAVAAPVVVSSSLVPTASIDSSTGAVATTPLTIGGFDLSSIPWWGWLAAGGAVLFMMGGKR
jgi:hypothetical protein